MLLPKIIGEVWWVCALLLHGTQHKSYLTAVTPSLFLKTVDSLPEELMMSLAMKCTFWVTNENIIVRFSFCKPKLYISATILTIMELEQLHQWQTHQENYFCAAAGAK